VRLALGNGKRDEPGCHRAAAKHDVVFEGLFDPEYAPAKRSSRSGKTTDGFADGAPGTSADSRDGDSIDPDAATVVRQYRAAGAERVSGKDYFSIHTPQSKIK